MHRFFVLVAGSIALSCTAFAGQITVVGSLPTSGQQTPNGSTSSFSVAQFDPALGVLASISFSLLGNAQGNYTFTNDDTSSSNIFQFLNPVTISVQNPFAAGNLVVTIPTLSDIVRTAGPSGTASAAYQTPNHPARSLTGTQTVTGTTIDAATLLGFTGPTGAPGSVTLAELASQSPRFNASTDFTAGNTTRNSGALSVTYNFTNAVSNATPELPSVSLLGSALVGLGFLRFRKTS